MDKATLMELALALILWKDFKSQGKFDAEATKQMFELAKHVGAREEVEEMLSKVPPMRIEERYPIGNEHDRILMRGDYG